MLITTMEQNVTELHYWACETI